MSVQVYFPDEIWYIIRSYIFHDIRFGLHTRGFKFDRVVAEIPRLPQGCDYIIWKGFFASRCVQLNPYVWIITQNIGKKLFNFF